MLLRIVQNYMPTYIGRCFVSDEPEPSWLELKDFQLGSGPFLSSSDIKKISSKIKKQVFFYILLAFLVYLRFSLWQMILFLLKVTDSRKNGSKKKAMYQKKKKKIQLGLSSKIKVPSSGSSLMFVQEQTVKIVVEKCTFGKKWNSTVVFNLIPSIYSKKGIQKFFEMTPSFFANLLMQSSDSPIRRIWPQIAQVLQVLVILKSKINCVNNMLSFRASF